MAKAVPAGILVGFWDVRDLNFVTKTQYIVMFWQHRHARVHLRRSRPQKGPKTTFGHLFGHILINFAPLGCLFGAPGRVCVPHGRALRILRRLLCQSPPAKGSQRQGHRTSGVVGKSHLDLLEEGFT
jgi:hypothetical protein